MIAQEVLNYKPSSETSPKSGSPRLKLYKGRSWIFRIFSQAMNRNFHNLNIIIRPCLTWEVTAELCLHFTQDGDWCQMPTFPAGLEDNRSFPSGSVVMSSAIHLQCWRHRRLKFYLWVRKIPWRREWQPTQDSCLKNPNGKRAWWATVTKSRTLSDLAHTHAGHFSSVAQSCLTLWLDGLQHARPPYPSPTPRAYSNSCP